MRPGRWFYRSDEPWDALEQRLKQTPCPHCKVVGMLIGHGFLRGYDESHRRPTAIRGRRIFCSNRLARRGCGRTFSVCRADIIRRHSLTTGSLWRFLRRAAAGAVASAGRTIGHLSDRTWQRLWRRFRLAQSRIRTALLSVCPPPAESSSTPPAQVLAHLHTAFPDADCPIAAFQITMRTFFV